MPLAENISERLTLKAYATGAITSNQLATSSSALGATGGQQLRFVSQNLSLQKTSIENTEKRTDRQSPLGRHGSRRVQGSISGLLSPGTYEEIFEAAMRGTWASMANTGASALGSVKATGSTFVFSSGNPVNQNLRVGDVTRFANLSTAANNGKDFLVLGFSGTSGRIMTVHPQPTAMPTDGAYTVAGQGKRLVVPSSGHVSRKFAIESYQSDIDVAELLTECRVGGFSIGLNADQNVSVEFPFVGRSREWYTSGNAPFFSGPAAQTTADICGPVGGVIRVNGVNQGVLTALDFNMDLSPQAPAVVGQAFTPEIFLGAARIAGNLSFFMEDSSLIETFDDETRISLLAWYPNSQADATEGLLFYMPYVQLGSLTKQDDGSGGKIVSGPFEAGPYAGTPPTGSTASILQIVDTAVP